MTLSVSTAKRTYSKDAVLMRLFLPLLVILAIVVSTDAWAFGPLVTNDFTYASSIDPINNLHGQVFYDSSSASMPLVVYAHPYSDNGAGLEDPCWDQNSTNMVTAWASNGWIVAQFSLRGRHGSGGTNDDSARELYDIWDGIHYVQTNSTYASKWNHYTTLVGFSGGGGNALGFACKFPDTIGMYVDYFGMSDYGYDSTFGWYQESGPHPSLQANIGGTPVAVPNAYWSRDALNAIATNLLGGFLYIYQNDSDSTVFPDQSSRVNTAFSSAGNNRILYTHSATLYQHQIPSSPPWLPDSFSQWSALVSSSADWSMPLTGTVRVLGYMKTKSWEIWLGGGTNSVADLTYDTTAQTFTVNPLTGSTQVRIYEGSCAVTNTISSQTTIVLCPPGPGLVSVGSMLIRGSLSIRQ